VLHVELLIRTRPQDAAEHGTARSDDAKDCRRTFRASLTGAQARQ
jgi:hypothetical protein